MTTTVEAIYEQGKLLLSGPLALPEKTHVRVTGRTWPGCSSKASKTTPAPTRK